MRSFIYFMVLLIFVVPVTAMKAREKIKTVHKTENSLTAVFDDPSIPQQQGRILRDLQKKFFEWRDELTRWRKAKLAEPDLPNEMTFDNIMPAPDDPALWPLWRGWLKQWRSPTKQSCCEIFTCVAGSRPLFNDRISLRCRFGWNRVKNFDTT